MRADLFTLTCNKLENPSLVGFRGKEQISQPYQYELFFTVPVGASARAAVGERATLKGDRGDGREPLVIHGVLANVRLLHQSSERALYRALLVPRLWLLRHFWRSFVFTGKSVQAFLSDTLIAGGLASNEFRFSIDPGLYADEEFVAQYRETHLEFFHRWLEREGLYYYFEHKAGEACELLVIADNRSMHEDFPGGGRVRYVPTFGDDATAPEGLHHLEADMSWLPKSVTIADYDYQNPAVPLMGESAVTKGGIGTIREYGYRVFGERDAKRLAEVRAMAIGCRESTMRASGDVLGPRAGYLLAVDDRPDELDEEWLAVEVELTGAIAGMTAEVARLTGLSATRTFEMKVFAIPASVQYRAPQTTAWPRIYGFENGIVCGPADSQYAQIDAEGRYHVRFEFDTSDLSDGKASTRVRMLQPHGGTTEGFHFPLRKGTEVMIGFLGGDCDRPFIAGVVPNAQKPSVVGERNHTQNIIRTGGGNQIVLEDEEGKEFIFLHTPNNATGIYMGNPAGTHAGVYTGEGDSQFHAFITTDAADPESDAENPPSLANKFTMSQVTGGNAGFIIGGNSWTNVTGCRVEYVKGDVNVGYGETYSLRVKGAVTENLHATRTTTVTGAVTETYKAGQKTTVTGALSYKAGPTKLDFGATTIDTGRLSFKVVGSAIYTITGQKTETTAACSETYDSQTTTVAGAYSLGASTIEQTASGITHTALGAYTINAVGAYTLNAPEEHQSYGMKSESGSLAMAATTLKVEGVGASMAAAGVSVSYTGVKLDKVSTELKTAAPVTVTAAISSILSAVHFYL